MIHFVGTIFYFPQNHPNFKVIPKIKGKPYNSGDGIGLQFPFITDQLKILSVLKQNSTRWKKSVNQDTSS